MYFAAPLTNEIAQHRAQESLPHKMEGAGWLLMPCQFLPLFQIWYLVRSPRTGPKAVPCIATSLMATLTGNPGPWRGRLWTGGSRDVYYPGNLFRRRSTSCPFRKLRGVTSPACLPACLLEMPVSTLEEGSCLASNIVLSWIFITSSSPTIFALFWRKIRESDSTNHPSFNPLAYRMPF